MTRIKRSRYGSQEAERMVLWGPAYEVVLTVLGTTGIIIPIGDTNDENSGRTTVTTRGEIQAVFTYSEAVTAFDSPPTLTGPGQIPVIQFNGTDEEADSPDDVYWSRVAGAFSVGAWINMADTTTVTILSKYDAAGNTREWVFQLSSTDSLQFFMFDEDAVANANINTESDSNITTNTWVFVVGTYDGSADATGISVYEDGIVAASTDTDDANFINLEDLGGTVKLAHLGATPTDLFDGSMAGGPLGPFFTQIELTADQVLALYQHGRALWGV